MAPVPTEIAVKNEAAADEMVLPTVTVKEEVQDRDESQGESLQVPFTEEWVVPKEEPSEISDLPHWGVSCSEDAAVTASPPVLPERLVTSPTVFTATVGSLKLQDAHLDPAAAGMGYVEMVHLCYSCFRTCLQHGGGVLGLRLRLT